MYCPKCELNTTEPVCPNCGRKTVPGRLCPVCKTANTPLEVVCPVCGYEWEEHQQSENNPNQASTSISKNDKLLKICPEGHINPLNRVFCSVCGKPLRPIQHPKKSFIAKLWDAVIEKIAGVA